MKYTETEIEGVWLIEPRVFEDARGYFFEAWKQADFDDHVGGHVFIGAEDKKRASAGFPSCGASYAVNVSVFAEGKMIVDDIVDVGNIESSRSKVGADEDV